MKPLIMIDKEFGEKVFEECFLSHRWVCQPHTQSEHNTKCKDKQIFQLVYSLNLLSPEEHSILLYYLFSRVLKCCFCGTRFVYNFSLVK